MSTSKKTYQSVDFIQTSPYLLFRNRSVGIRIGKGEKLDEITKSMAAVAEGVLTSKSAQLLAQKVGVECHVIEGIYKVGTTRLLRLYSTLRRQNNDIFIQFRSFMKMRTLWKSLLATCPGH